MTIRKHTLVIIFFLTALSTFSQVPVDNESCKEKGFWSLDGFGNILQWQINSGTVSFIDTIQFSTLLTSLAYCDTLNTASIGSTFYGSNYFGLPDIYYYDGIQWKSASTGLSQNMSNAAGYRQFLYFTGISPGMGFLNEIYRFDGDTLVRIFHSPVRYLCLADLAVDDDGNSWSLMGNQMQQSDSLCIFDSLGNIVQSYSISLNTVHGYGSFMQNGIFYIAFGSANTQYPSSLVSIGLTGSQAFVQNVYPFPNSDFMDLASCDPGSPLTLDIKYPEPDQINIYPNPFEEKISVCWPDEGIATITLFDQVGKIIIGKECLSPALINTNNIAPGIYHMTVYSGERIFSKLIVKGK